MNMSQGFIRNGRGYVIVHCDGACPGNGKPDAKAGIGIWFGKNHSLNVSESLNREKLTDPPTNNIAEIKAVIKACVILQNYGVQRVSIHTDSKYLINSMEIWIHKWKRNGWRTSKGQPVKHKNEYLRLFELLSRFQDYELKHVLSEENEADPYAKKGAEYY